MRFRRGVIVFLLLALLLSLAAFAYNGDVTVYITNTGECYHRDGCSYLKSRIPTSLENAVNRGYRACSRCHPPRLNQDSSSDTDPYRAPKKSSGPSSSSSYSAATTPKASPKTQSESRAGQLSLGAKILAGFGGVILVLVCVGGAIGIVGFFGSVVISAIRSRKEAAAEEARERQQRQEQREEYMELYAGKSLEELVAFPEGAHLTDDLLPYLETGRGRWGGKYTFFKTASGQCYHRYRNCNHANIEVNAFTLSEYARPRTRLRPCRVCNPVLPDVHWVQECRKIANIKREYDIP